MEYGCNECGKSFAAHGNDPNAPCPRKGVRIIGRFGYDMQAGEMRRALGVKKLPKEAMPEREIAGVRVYVKAQEIGNLRPSRRKHRVFAVCTCGQHVPFGRLHQHKCK